MDQKLNIELLEKLSIENLHIVKSEAEFNLDELAKSEEIITNKANTLFQVLIVVVTGIIGYLVNQLVNLNIYSILLHVSIIIVLFFTYSITALFKVVYPVSTGLKGSAPSKLITKPIFKANTNESYTLSLLRSRIYSIDKAIKNNIEKHETRLKLFDNANKCVIVGIVISAIYPLFYYSLLSLLRLLSI